MAAAAGDVHGVKVQSQFWVVATRFIYFDTGKQGGARSTRRGRGSGRKKGRRRVTCRRKSPPRSSSRSSRSSRSKTVRAPPVSHRAAQPAAHLSPKPRTPPVTRCGPSPNFIAKCVPFRGGTIHSWHEKEKMNTSFTSSISVLATVSYDVARNA